MFSRLEGLKDRDPKNAITSDFKIYSEKGIKVGIGQCEVTTLNDLMDYANEYSSALEDVRAEKGLEWSVLMVTDVVHEHSALICTPFRGNRNLPYQLIKGNIYDMPNVMSRKKQLLPEIIHAVDE